MPRYALIVQASAAIPQLAREILRSQRRARLSRSVASRWACLDPGGAVTTQSTTDQMMNAVMSRAAKPMTTVMIHQMPSANMVRRVMVLSTRTSSSVPSRT